MKNIYKNQKGKGKTMTTTPSEYQDFKNSIGYKIRDIASRFYGDTPPIDPNPSNQTYDMGKFDISPPPTLTLN